MNTLLIPKLKTPSAAQKALPFYNLLPKNPIEVLKWKIYCRERCKSDTVFREVIRQMCQKDVAFWATTFLWLHETRPGLTKTVGRFPFIPDCDQVDALAWVSKYLGYEDLTIFKTRAIGGSYLVCIVLLWLWLFNGESLDYALVSKDEESLDIKNRPSSLMGKLDLLFQSLPFWMRQDSAGHEILKRTTTTHQFHNLHNNNTILGFVPTRHEKLRSGRYFCVILDEAAFFPADIQRWVVSAHGTTNSILWLSTFDGAGNMFYRLATNDNAELIRIELYWQTNPRWAAGMYKSVNGQIHIMDPEYSFKDFEFAHDEPGLERSPMVDFYLNRAGADREKVKEELYGSIVADSRSIFYPVVFDRLRVSESAPPWRGFILETGEFKDELDGDWYFWKPPELCKGRFIIGCDPALGAGFSSAFAASAVLDSYTGEVIATYAKRPVECHDFAKHTVECCKLLSSNKGVGPPQIAYESTGTGVLFVNELRRLNYSNIYQERKNVSGIHTQDRGEKILLELGRAIRDREIAVHDKRVIQELKAFEYDREDNMIYTGEDGHGDLAIATALAWWAAKDYRKAIIASQKAKEKDPVAADLELRYKDAKKLRSWSDRVFAFK